jgi:hypothetical protein
MWLSASRGILLFTGCIYGICFFVFLLPDLLSHVSLAKGKRPEDSESNHGAICHTGFDVFMVSNSAIGNESAYSPGYSERRRGRVGVSLLYLVLDLRIYDCVK